MDTQKQVKIAKLAIQFLKDESINAHEFVSRQTSDVQEAQEAVAIVEAIARYNAIPPPSEKSREATIRKVQRRQRERNLAQVEARSTQIPFQTVAQYARDLLGAQWVLNRTTNVAEVSPSQRQEPYNQHIFDRQARDAATELTQEMQDDNEYTLPIDPLHVAKYLGIFVQEFRLQKEEGCLFRQNSLVAMLLNSSSDDERRKRYTCAHEIGHSVLHKDVSFFQDDKKVARNFSDIRERQANVFASYLLAPLLETKPFLQDTPSMYQAGVIKQTFQLSLAAALIRIVMDSDWDCGLVASRSGIVQWAFMGENFHGFIPKGGRVPLLSVAHLLEQEGGSRTYEGVVDPGQWLPDVNPLVEESFRTSSGWTYTILRPL